MNFSMSFSVGKQVSRLSYSRGDRGVLAHRFGKCHSFCDSPNLSLSAFFILLASYFSIPTLCIFSSGCIRGRVSIYIFYHPGATAPVYLYSPMLRCPLVGQWTPMLASDWLKAPILLAVLALWEHSVSILFVELWDK